MTKSGGPQPMPDYTDYGDNERPREPTAQDALLALGERFVAAIEKAVSHLPDYSNLTATSCPVCARIFLVGDGQDTPYHAECPRASP